VGVGSGTEAIWLTLLGLGIGQGDEVITVPNTFIATAEAISFCGATPVFVDIDERTYTMNPDLLETAITPRSKAVIPVHLFGQPADMDPIMKVARSNGLFVIEDACQAHGALYKGINAGGIGDAGCFSFYPGKNLGAFGEAGAVVTNDDGLAETLRILRDHGQPRKYHHSKVGWNARMDGLQGAVLSVKLRHLSNWNESRRGNARKYNELLADLNDVVTPTEAEYAKHVYHVYAVCAQDRDRLSAALTEKDIHCGIHYPIPVHLQKAYYPLRLGKSSFPVSEKCADGFISLPMFPELTEDQIAFVAEEIKGYFCT
jgi:dTDP-4-amino-4,6-dideoxygalactose transaminase